MTKRGKKCNSTNFNNSHFQEHILVIKNDKHLVLCLVCKELLADSDPNKISVHVLGQNHQENLKKWFKMCVPDELCDSNGANFMKIISNSVSDLSILLKNKTSCLHQYKSHIVCLICQDVICEVNHCVDTLKDDIFQHVHSKQHVNHVRLNVCWVYQLETEAGFVMFHKTVMFCSVCEQKYQTQESYLLQYVLDHLSTKHPKEMNEVHVSLIDSEQTDTGQIPSKLLGKNPQCYSPHGAKNCSDTIGNTKAPVGNGEREISIHEFNIANHPWSFDQLSASKPKEIVKNGPETGNQVTTKLELLKRDDIHPFIITIQCSKKFTFCVVCKDIVPDLNSGSQISSHISSHLQSPKHQESMESLAFHCIPDPFCDKSTENYNELVSVLHNETGCVVQNENYIVCLICKNVVTNINQTFGTVKYDLVYHFGSKKHLVSIKENVWWFYYFKFGKEFIAFDSHLSDCDSCAVNPENIPNQVVQCVNDHLQLQDHTLLDSITTDYNGLMCPECKEVVEIYNDDRKFSMNLHLEKHRALSEVNNYYDVDMIDDDAEYTCPVCLEEILIFNNDMKLSLSLHGCNTIERTASQDFNEVDYDVSMVFDHLPQIFKVHSDFITMDRGELYCKLCNCTLFLPSSFEEACKYVQKHVTELYHKEQYNIFIVTPQTTTKTDPWDLFKNVSDPETLSLMNSVVEENKEYIGKCEKYYFCKVCMCCFLSFGNEQEVTRIFASHFMCKNHKKKLGRYLNEERITDEAVQSTNEEITNNHVHQTDAVEIKSNKAIFNKLRSLTGFQLNSEFLAIKGDKVYCKLCKMCFPSNKIGKVRKHCYSERHSLILVENAANYITNIEKKQDLKVADPCNQKFVSVLKKLAETHYKLNDPTVTPNLLYIDNNGKSFVCLICKINIKFSVNGSKLISHFQTNVHKRMTYILNCENPLKNDKEISRVNQRVNQMSGGRNENMTVAEKEVTNCEKETIGIQISDFFEKLPDEYSLYRNFISMNGKHVYCVLCSFTLLSKKDFDVDCKTLQEHLSSPFHREQYLLYNSNELPNGPGQGSSVKNDPWERFDDSTNFEVRLEVQQLNERNKEYIEKGEIYFMCCLCNIYFVYFDEEDMRFTFAAHCLTSNHLKNVKRYSTKYESGALSKVNNDNKIQAMKINATSVLIPKFCVTDIKNDVSSVLKKVTKSPFVMALNKHYLRERDNLFFCDVCQIFIEFNENGSHLKKHCYSQTHNNILIQNAINFVEGLGLKKNLNDSNSGGLTFRNVLKNMAKLSYMESKTIITANLFFISYNTKEFVCHLCNKKLKFLENGGTITGHFKTKAHANEALKLNCTSRSNTPFDDTPTEDLKEAVTDNKVESNTSSDELINFVFESNTKTEDSQAENSKEAVTSSNLELDTSSGDLIVSIFRSNILTEDMQVENPKEVITNVSDELNVEIANLMSQVVNDKKACQEEIKMCHEKPLNSNMKSINMTKDPVCFVSSTVFDKNEDYVCPHCNKVVTIISGDVKGSFELHFKDCHCNIEELLSVHEAVLCNRKFINEIFECLPDSHQWLREHVSVQMDTIYCNLCKSFVEIDREDLFTYAVQLYFHFSSKFHKEQDKLSKEDGSDQQRLKYKPELFDKNNAPGDIEVVHSISEMQNTTNKSCDEEVGYKETSDYRNQFLSKVESAISEEGMFRDNPVDLEMTRGVRNHLEDTNHSQNLSLSGSNQSLSTDDAKNSQKTENVLSPVAQSSQYEPKNKVQSSNQSVKHSQDNVSLQKHTHLSKKFKNKYSVPEPLVQKLKESVWMPRRMLEENLEFIFLHGTNFHCCLCDKGISYSPNYETLAKQFSAHLTSDIHTCYLRKLHRHKK